MRDDSASLLQVLGNAPFNGPPPGDDAWGCLALFRDDGKHSLGDGHHVAQLLERGWLQVLHLEEPQPIGRHARHGSIEATCRYRRTLAGDRALIAAMKLEPAA